MVTKGKMSLHCTVFAFQLLSTGWKRLRFSCCYSCSTTSMLTLRGLHWVTFQRLPSSSCNGQRKMCHCLCLFSLELTAPVGFLECLCRLCCDHAPWLSSTCWLRQSPILFCFSYTALTSYCGRRRHCLALEWQQRMLQQCYGRLSRWQSLVELLPWWQQVRRLVASFSHRSSVGCLTYQPLAAQCPWSTC